MNKRLYFVFNSANMKYITVLLCILGVNVHSVDPQCTISIDCQHGPVDPNTEVVLLGKWGINCSDIVNFAKDEKLSSENCTQLQNLVNSTCCASSAPVTNAPVPVSTPTLMPANPTSTPTTVPTSSPTASPTTAPVPTPNIKNERNDTVTTNIVIRMDSVPSKLNLLEKFSFENRMQAFLQNLTTIILNGTLNANLLKVLVNVSVTDQRVFQQSNRRLSQRLNERSMQKVEALSNEMSMKIDGFIMCKEDDKTYTNDLIWRDVIIQAISQNYTILIESLRQSNETYLNLTTITVIDKQVSIDEGSISSGAIAGIVIATLVVFVSCVIAYTYMKSKENNDHTICENESVKKNSFHEDNDDEIVKQTNMLDENEQAQEHKIKVPDMSWAAILTKKEMDTPSDIEIFKEASSVTNNNKQVPKRLNQNPLIGTSRGYIKKTITLPNGELGISIATNIELGPTISEVRSGSQLEGMVNVGNIILSVNGTDTRCLSGVSVAQILIDTCTIPERKMVLKI